MLLWNIGYMALSGIIFIIAASPLNNQFKTTESFVAGLWRILKERKKGSIFLAFAFLNVIISVVLNYFI